MERFQQRSLKKSFNPLVQTSWFILTGLILISIIGYLKQKEQAKNTNYTLQGGLNTCFKRVTQSFMAFHLNLESSKYLSKEFSQVSQDCFSELLETQPKEEFGFSELTTEIFWFFKNLNNSKNMVQRKNVINSYVKLESMTSDLYETIELKVKLLNRERNYLFLLLASVVFIGMIFSFRNLILRMKFTKISDYYEQMARNFYLDYNLPDSTIINECIGDFLRDLKLNNCSLLLDKFHTGISNNRFVRYDPLRTYLYNKKIIPGKVKENNRQMNTKSLEGTESANLYSAFSKIASIYSDKLLSEEIIFKYSVDKDLWVNGEEDSLVQILFVLISNSYTSIKERSAKEKGKIEIKVRDIEGTVILYVMDNGKGFSTNETTQKSNFEYEILDEGIGLSVCKKLISEMSGRISFRNHLDKDGKIIGAKLMLFFVRSERKTIKNDIALSKKDDNNKFEKLRGSRNEVTRYGPIR